MSGHLLGAIIDDPIVSIPAAVATVLVAYGVIYRKGIIPIYHFFQNVGRIADSTPTLIGIAEEFKGNGGHSLRDTVDRIESKIESKMDEHAALFRRIASIEERIGNLENPST